jgi:hypothetical protein
MQEEQNPLNGTKVNNAKDLSEMLDSLRHQEPFIFELKGDNAYALTVGLGDEIGCVQCTPSNGDPLWFIAVAQGT